LQRQPNLRISAFRSTAKALQAASNIVVNSVEFGGNPVGIVRSLHTAILVRDLERAQAFYGTVLGLEQVDRSLRYPGVWYQVGDYQLHLLVDADTPHGLHNSQKWGRNRHIAFAVTDIQTAKAALTEQGYPVQMSASGRAALFTYDPDGNVVELSEL
jgi:glyoxylase I family protein